MQESKLSWATPLSRLYVSLAVLAVLKSLPHFNASSLSPPRSPYQLNWTNDIGDINCLCNWIKYRFTIFLHAIITRLPWVPETFLARFLVASAVGRSCVVRLRPTPKIPTAREKTSGTQGITRSQSSVCWSMSSQTASTPPLEGETRGRVRLARFALVRLLRCSYATLNWFWGKNRLFCSLMKSFFNWREYISREEFDSLTGVNNTLVNWLWF